MKIKVSEIFKSIQGEGKDAGVPMLFIRLSGCTRACDFCDTKYHTEGEYFEVNELIKKIKESKMKVVCWTGGEPLLQIKAIKEVMNELEGVKNHIETNGDLINEENFDNLREFEYIGCSPKVLQVAKDVCKKISDRNSLFYNNIDIKIVTDLETVGKDMIKYATMLMPLTTYNKEKDLKIQQKVWDYCVENNLKFTPRYQVWVWNDKKGR
jgi:7-carboxy-7-deazaguanine synthase